MIQVVVGVIAFGDRFLLMQRLPTRDYPHAWESPGGKVERTDVSLKAALMRELREELGQFDYTLGDKPILQTAALDEVPVPSLMFYLVSPRGVFVPKTHAAIGCGWFTLDEMERLSLAPGNRLLCAHLRSARGGE